jgi:hypothetical protein
VLQALDELPGSEMLANLLLAQRRQLFDVGGDQRFPSRYDT